MPNKLLTVQKTYGNLTVLGRDRSSAGRIEWKCRCSCGSIVFVTGGNLRKGERSSCGCLSGKYRLRPYESLYRRLKSSTTKAFSLTYETFLEFVKIPECHYCGHKVVWSKHNVGKNGNAYNLDRVNNKVGYTAQNCVVCCGTCNRMKGTLDVREFLLHIKRITKRLK